MAEMCRVRCNHCMSVFDAEYLKKGVDDRGDFYESCPVCSKRDALMDIMESDATTVRKVQWALARR